MLGRWAFETRTVTDLGEGARGTCISSQSNFFSIFMQFSAKIMANNRLAPPPLEVGAPFRKSWIRHRGGFYFYRPQRSSGKVIFSQACVKNSVHGEGACVAEGSVHGRGACAVGGVRAWQEKWQLQWAVRILLECILVFCKISLKWAVTLNIVSL